MLLETLLRNVGSGLILFEKQGAMCERFSFRQSSPTLVIHLLVNQSLTCLNGMAECAGRGKMEVVANMDAVAAAETTLFNSRIS